MIDQPVIPEENINVLSTDYAPWNSQDLASLRIRLEANKKELSVLNEATPASGPRFNYFDSHRLQRHRDRLQNLCRVGEGLLAPIRRIPEDILGYIFALAVPILQLQDFGRFFGAPALPVQSGELHPHVVRLCLIQVCRRWTRIMFDAPNVWTTVVVDNFIPPQILQMTLNNSRACPLNIFLNLPWHTTRDGSILLQLIHQEMSRVNCLIAYQPSCRMFHQLFQSGITVDAPRLETLQFVTSGPGVDMPETTSGSVHAPKLKSVDVDAHTFPALKNIEFSRLRRLGLSQTIQISASGLLQLLANCSNIQQICLPRTDKWRREEERVVWAPKSVVLFSLKELRLSLHDKCISTQFCAAVHIPSLEILDISIAIEDSAVSILETLLQHSAVFLRDLTIRSHPPTHPLTGVSIRPLLSRLTNIRSLRFTFGGLDAGFFSVLTPCQSIPPEMWICPHLTHLEFNHVNFPGDGIMRLINTRTRLDPDGQSHGRFLAISFVACGGLKNYHISQLLELQGRTCSQVLQISIQ